MFSLNNNKIYKILVPESAIGFYNGDPIRIGNTGNSNGIWINSGKIHESCSTREGGGVGAYTGEGGGPHPPEGEALTLSRFCKNRVKCEKNYTYNLIFL